MALGDISEDDCEVYCAGIRRVEEMVARIAVEEGPRFASDWIDAVLLPRLRGAASPVDARKARGAL